MFILRQLRRHRCQPLLPTSASTTRPRPRLFSHSATAAGGGDDEFAGLQLHDTAVQRFLRSVRAEHTELGRSEQRSRTGHRRLAQLQPLVRLLDARDEQQLQLGQLLDEERRSKAANDAELLALIAEEKTVRHRINL